MTPGLKIFGSVVKSITVDSIPNFEFPPLIIILNFFLKSYYLTIILVCWGNTSNSITVASKCFGIEALINLSHSLNAPSPIFVTEFGIVTD